MINFNEPVYLEKSMEYVKKAILVNKCLNGDGEFTKKCSNWMEKSLMQKKLCLQHHVRMDWKWQLYYVIFIREMK